jgi:mannan endo-1,4-beta-mannosidase
MVFTFVVYQPPMKRILPVIFLIVIQQGFSQVDPHRASTHLPINQTLVTTNASEGAKRLYRFLYDNYGVKVISGAMTLNSFDETLWLKENTGKEPALVGLDFMHSGRGYTWYNDKQPADDARTWYNRNGIPAICWHWRDPSRKTEEFYTAKTTFDVSKIFDENSPEYVSMIADIDYVSGILKELQQDDIPVIWRPLHEAAGGWFWWGAKGAAPCKKLYQIMFDRMVNHHGLNNLIWVWTREPNDDAWYPGDEYVDIVSRDIYKDGDHGSQIAEWSDMNERYNEKKMIALSECGSCPDADNLVLDKAAWSWYMPWYGQFVRESKYNSLQFWQKMFAHDYVLTLDEMPDLKTYEGVDHPVVGVAEHAGKQLSVYPTVTEDSVFIVSAQPIGVVQVTDRSGKVVLKQQIKGIRGTLVLSSLPAGLYYVRIKDNPAVKVVKR